MQVNISNKATASQAEGHEFEPRLPFVKETRLFTIQ